MQVQYVAQYDNYTCMDFQRFAVAFSMLEIYNEQVRDLLSKENPKGGLQVRQNPSLGLFYVQGLKKVPVGSYQEIEKRMNQGRFIRIPKNKNIILEINLNIPNIISFLNCYYIYL
jgi:hypothetical protein